MTVMAERRSGGWWRPGHGGLMLTTWWVAVAAVVMAAPEVALAQTTLPPPCDSKIYCYGELLKTVQMAELHNDSKYFVDMPLKNSPNDTLRVFQDLMNKTHNNPTKEDVSNFVAENFEEPGSEFVPWVPDDWEAELWISLCGIKWNGRVDVYNVAVCPRVYNVAVCPRVYNGGRVSQSV
ncbi:hypothetical protein Pmani_025479 [Petrolisthes manimaculis]|uniref:Trehalase n=1 Tax=Petrolisthes manimaculis TaxID=1843537 RepID=A0AAE1P5F2_9EUCA|nr:hypothetical protein Pmani_025479 [Petrolisthes manimaculis]